MVLNRYRNRSDRNCTWIGKNASFYRIFIVICSFILIFQSAGLALAIDLPLYAGNTILYEDATKNFSWYQDDVYDVQNDNANSIYLIFLVNTATYRVLTRTTNGSQIQGAIYYHPGAIQTVPKDYTDISYKTNVFLGYLSAGSTFYVGVPSNQTKIYHYWFSNGYAGGTVARFQSKFWTETYGTSSYSSVTPPGPINSLRLPNVTWTTPMGQVITLTYQICAVEIPSRTRVTFSIAFGHDLPITKKFANLGWITSNGQKYWSISYNDESKYIKVRPFFLGIANATGNVRVFFNNTELTSLNYLNLGSTNLITSETETYEILQLDPPAETIETAPSSSISTDTVYSTNSIFSFITNFQEKLKSFFNLLLAPLTKFREVKQ